MMTSGLEPVSCHLAETTGTRRHLSAKPVEYATASMTAMGHLDSFATSMSNVLPVRKQPIASSSPKSPSGPSQFKRD
jgi:hypothetical protein